MENQQEPTQQIPQQPPVPIALQYPLENAQSDSSHTKLILFIFVVILLLCGIGFLFFAQKNAAPQTSRSNAIPQPTITDLAPGVPADQKTTILVQHSDSSQEKITMPTSMVTNYTKTLPEGDKVISQ